MARGFRFSGSFSCLVFGFAAFSALPSLPSGVALSAPQTGEADPPPFPLPGDVVFGTPHLRGDASCVTFSPDGKFAVAAGVGPIRFWDISTGLVDHQLESSINYFQTIAYSPDGKLLAAGGRGGGLVVWDAETHEEVFTNEGTGAFENTITSLAFSPDGRRLITGSRDMRMRVWDAQSGEQLTEVALTNNRGAATVVACSPEGKYIAATSLGKNHVFDAETYHEVHVIPAHRLQINSLVFASEAQLISAGTETLRVDGQFQQTGVVRVWKMSRGSLLRQLKFAEPPVNVQAICLTPDREHIVMSARNEIRIVRLSDAKVTRRVGSFGQATILPQGLAISADGKYVARAVSDAAVLELYGTDSASRVTYSEAAGHDARISNVLFSPDSSTLATIGSDGRILFWDADSGETTGNFHCGPDTFPQSAVWSADGDKLYVAGGQAALNQPRGFLIGIDARDQSEVLRAGFDNQVLSCALSPDGSELAVCEGNNRRISGTPIPQSSLQVLSADSAQVLAQITPTIAYGHLRFSPDGRRLHALASVFGETLDVWDLRDGTVFRKGRVTPY